MKSSAPTVRDRGPGLHFVVLLPKLLPGTTCLPQCNRQSAVPHFAPPERESVPPERDGVNLVSPPERDGGDLVAWGGDLGCGGGGLGEVVCGGGHRLSSEGGGVGLRRGSRRHRCASTKTWSTAMHPPRLSIDDGAVSATASSTARHNIEHGAVSRTAGDLHVSFSG
jgi:hypothetical protein